MKKTLIAGSISMLFAAGSAIAGDIDIQTNNNSYKNIAVGGNTNVNVPGLGSGSTTNSKAAAGSVVVLARYSEGNNDLDVMVNNTSHDNIAVGNAAAGSTVVTAGCGC